MKLRAGKWAMVLTVLAGCTQPGSHAADVMPLPVTALSSQGQCGRLDRPAVRWIIRSDEWRDLYAQANSHWMNPPLPPVVDFSREGVLLIAMGQRSTAGYGLTLTDDTATMRDGVLTVRVNWREPPPGSRQAQVMINPCLLVALPNAGFNHVRVVDQEGRVRLEGDR